MARVTRLLILCFGLLLPCSVATLAIGDDRREPLHSRSDTATSDNLEYVPPTWPEPPDTGAMLIRLAAGTGTVLVLCVLTMVVGRRWLHGPAPKAPPGSQLEIVESVTLGNRCCVHLLRAGQHRLVVGVDGAGLKSMIALPEMFEKSLVDVELHDREAAEAPAEAIMPGAA